MTLDADAQPISPEPLALLLAVTPNRVLLDIIKSDRRLASIIFQGFAARVQSLALPAVRARLERELPKFPDIRDTLFSLWMEIAAPMMDELNAPDFIPTPETLAPLLEDFGEEPLRYALLHANRDDVRAWGERMDEIVLPEVVRLIDAPDLQAVNSTQVVSLQQEITALNGRVRELQHALRDAEKAQESTRRELTALERQLDAAGEMETLLRKQIDALEGQFDRERRRAKRAEEETEQLRNQLKEFRQASPTPKPTNPTAAIAEAVALLQQGLQSLQGSAPPEPTPKPVAPKPKPEPIRQPAPETSITLPGARAARAYPLSGILGALQRNDVATVEKVRDGLARLADQPAKEREALQKLAKAGIPSAVLTGPLRPAVVDGSNIANMSHAARGKLAYLEQIQRSAWAEGYFPVLIIVDASLRYQIDQSDALMQMVESGRITMTEPGTPADPVLIREAKTRNAVLITNDRMDDWPDSKTVDRRKASMAHGAVRVGSFHTSVTSWFHR